MKKANKNYFFTVSSNTGSLWTFSKNKQKKLFFKHGQLSMWESLPQDVSVKFSSLLEVTEQIRRKILH